MSNCFGVKDSLGLKKVGSEETHFFLVADKITFIIKINLASFPLQVMKINKKYNKDWNRINTKYGSSDTNHFPLIA